uniref:Uncharacterized protein n=1 Tax=Cannabis sativa TaxID=3483 RepID=A0A803QFL0_CANSA
MSLKGCRDVELKEEEGSKDNDVVPSIQVVDLKRRKTIMESDYNGEEIDELVGPYDKMVQDVSGVEYEDVNMGFSDGSISVMGEPWLPDENNPLVTSSHPTLASDTVASLMSMDNGGWDNEIIEDLFETRDQQLIKSIPLQAPTAMDRLYWTLETSEFIR